MPKLPKAQVGFACDLEAPCKLTGLVKPFYCCTQGAVGCLPLGCIVDLSYHSETALKKCAQSQRAVGLQDDRRVTSMVPASVRVRREEPSLKPRLGPGAAAAHSRPVVGPGFGLAPVAARAPAANGSAATSVARPAPGAAPGATAVDQKYQAFLAEMSELGAV